VYYLFIYLHCLFLIAIMTRRWLWELIGARWAGSWAASRRARQVTLNHIDPMCFLSLVYTLACMHLIGLPNLCTFRIWVYTWLVILSHAVLSVVQVLHLLWCQILACVLLRVVVFHPSRCELIVWGSMLWFEQGFGMVQRVMSIRECGCSNMLRTKS
jgi:hypothetical protein